MNYIAILLLIGQPQQAPPIKPQQAPVVERPRHEEIAKKAYAAGMPVVILVGIDQDVGSAIKVRDDQSALGRGAHLMSPTEDGWLVYRGSWKVVSRVASPFEQQDSQLIADDEESAIGRWPTSIPYPYEATRYRRAQFTQSIATTDNAPSISRVHRSQTKREWQIPGGLEGVVGWRSDLYKYVPIGWQMSWKARLPVLNSFGNYQYELGYTRAYPDGTWFADLLSKDGKPFELRIREKHGGRWDAYVAFRDRDVRPQGYHGVGKRCVECHNLTNGPGTGGYGAGLVAGADTVFSDPFGELE